MGTRLFYRKHFHKQHLAETGKNQAKADQHSEVNLCYWKITRFLYIYVISQKL